MVFACFCCFSRFTFPFKMITVQLVSTNFTVTICTNYCCTTVVRIAAKYLERQNIDLDSIEQSEYAFRAFLKRIYDNARKLQRHGPGRSQRFNIPTSVKFRVRGYET